MDLFVTKQKQVKYGDKTYPCAIGRSGFVSADEKKEGDGATPVGRYQLRKIYYRADRLTKPIVDGLPTQAITNDGGWCDDPHHASYNQHIKRPFEASHERLWREDDLYNIVIEISHNQYPVVPHKGSAIFIHVAGENYTPTEGCIALKQEDLEEIISAMEPDAYLTILED